jgi:hypothetical protein
MENVELKIESCSYKGYWIGSTILKADYLGHRRTPQRRQCKVLVLLLLSLFLLPH